MKSLHLVLAMEVLVAGGLRAANQIRLAPEQILLAPGSGVDGQKLTYVDLVHRLTDLEYLATLPAPGEQCAQWSSYDRKSRYDSATGKYLDWDANGDGERIHPQGGGQGSDGRNGRPGLHLADLVGHAQGGPRAHLFGRRERAGGGLALLRLFRRQERALHPLRAGPHRGHGWNNYTPIPYQKSCKIVADTDWGAYYHFIYETFPKGTQVPTFSRELAAEDSAALDQANAVLSNCGPDRPYRILRTPDAVDRTIEARTEPDQLGDHTRRAGGHHRHPRQTRLASSAGGPRFVARIMPPDQLGRRKGPERLGALGRFLWNGARRRTATAPSRSGSRMTAGGTAIGTCRLRRRRSVGLINDGAVQRQVSFRDHLRALVAADRRNWAVFTPSGIVMRSCRREPDRRIDWPILKTEGAGRFVGVMLHVWNPRGGWWGEGDEKFFVDGEKFPSTFGTGSEDYFGYAWCCPELFQHAFHNQTHNDGNNRGHVSVNRWQIRDNVPFQQVVRRLHREVLFQPAANTLRRHGVLVLVCRGQGSLSNPRH